jgi:hypothetical protein
MPVTATLKEAYGASPTIVTAAYLNFLAADAASGSDATTAPLANPVQIPATSGTNYSYDRWAYLLFAGNTNAITGILAWKSAGSLNTGYVINGKVKASAPTTYVQSSVATTYAGTSAIPTTSGSGMAPTYNASGTKSDYMVMQLAVSDTAAAGPMVGTAGSPGTWTLAWSYNTTG